jgi:hypothetical protein
VYLIERYIGRNGSLGEDMEHYARTDGWQLARIADKADIDRLRQRPKKTLDVRKIND